MFSGVTAEPLRAYPLHERQHSDQLRAYAPPSRPLVELPRPLEPRPTHQAQPTHHETGRGDRRPDAFHQPAPLQPEYRPQTQSLPRLHDILTSGPSGPQSHYSSSWSNNAGSPAHQQITDGHHSNTGWHPPLANPPHGHEHSQSYSSQQGRRLELPTMETSPVTRHDSHAIPHSPYHGYREAPKKYDPRLERPRETSASAYMPNGVPSPYASAGAEDGHYRSPAGSMVSAAGYPPAPESSKKYIGVREIPGEGTFHFYEGGYRIPTSVDGESVNPAWGLTKANKPRKRLAMACLDCREKKIKCEPGASSCLQCEKAKRPCRKAPTHQSQSELNTTPVWSSSAGSPIRKGIPDPTPTSAREMELDTTNKRRTMEDASPSNIPTKKHRSTSPVYTVNGHSRQDHEAFYNGTSPPAPRSPGKVVSIDEDPFAFEPEMTTRLLEHFLLNVNDTTHCIFPRHHLTHWLKAYPQKCQSERMVLYAILALGSTFADDSYSGFGKHCANVAAEAMQSNAGRFNLAIILTRLLLGLYHFARGANSTALEYIAAGIHVATFLRYNTEAGCAEEDATVDKSRNEFALSKEQLVECKRRTLWAGFLMDRYCGATQTLLNPQDIFIRLPSTDDSYERGFASNAPYHNNGIIDPVKAVLTASSAISPMGWLIPIAAIWGDVVSFIYRAVHRAPSSYEEQYEKVYEDTRTALQNWQSRLPDHLRFSQANIERSIQSGYAGLFISMHSLYHLCALKLNRFVRHEYIPRFIARNVRATHRHAMELLQVTGSLRAANDRLAKDNHQTYSLTTPLTGYAILAAIDVVGAGGHDTNLNTTLDLIGNGLECLRELGRYWNSARDQHKACEKRFYQINNVVKHPFTARSGCWLGREWGVHSSLEMEFALQDDCIYGVTDRDYFDALKDDLNEGRAPNGALRVA